MEEAKKVDDMTGTKSLNTKVIFVLLNEELPYILNGKAHFTIEKHPFYYLFTPANIFKIWIEIGFVPFSCLRFLAKEVLIEG